jgi:hypothetical protein
MRCPGQDMQYWKPGAIFEANCPKCGGIVEFFKDDTARKCGACGHRFVNPKMDFGCAAYCPYAEQCLGTLPEGLAAQKENLLKDRVAVEMKRYFKNDFRRIGRASRVARYAERIGKAEGGNLAVILSAAYLHDVGRDEACREGADTHPETEGPAVAREILAKLGARDELIAEVCEIIAHRHHSRPGDSVNLRVLRDAETLETLDEEHKSRPLEAGQLTERIERSFLTAAGREAARETLEGVSKPRITPEGNEQGDSKAGQP